MRTPNARAGEPLRTPNARTGEPLRTPNARACIGNGDPSRARSSRRTTSAPDLLVWSQVLQAILCWRSWARVGPRSLCEPPKRARARESLIIVEFRPGRWALPHHRDMAPFIPLWNECRRHLGLAGRLQPSRHVESGAMRTACSLAPSDARNTRRPAETPHRGHESADARDAGGKSSR